MRTGGGRSSSGHSQLASYTACAYTTSGITSTRYAPCCALVACLIPTKHALAFHAAGVRPSQKEVANEAATDDWLVKNVCVAGCDDSCHETTEDNRYRVYLPDDLVARGRELHDREQLRAWPYFWADRELELRWLGLDIGFGVFAACTLTKQCSMLRIQDVADYDVRDPHALIRVNATKSDRVQRCFTTDIVSLYGPATLVNAACSLHYLLDFQDYDIGLGGKLVSFFRKTKQGTVQGSGGEATVILSANYPPPSGQQCWSCPAVISYKGEKVQPTTQHIS